MNGWGLTPEYWQRRGEALRQLVRDAALADAIKKAKRGDLEPLHAWICQHPASTEAHILMDIGGVFADPGNWPKGWVGPPQRYACLKRYALALVRERLQLRRRKNGGRKLKKGTVPYVVDNVIAELIEEGDLKFHDNTDTFRAEILGAINRGDENRQQRRRPLSPEQPHQ